MDTLLRLIPKPFLLIGTAAIQSVAKKIPSEMETTSLRAGKRSKTKQHPPTMRNGKS